MKFTEEAEKFIYELILNHKIAWCDYDNDLFEEARHLLITCENSPLTTIDNETWKCAKTVNECYTWEVIVPEFAAIRYPAIAKKEADEFIWMNEDREFDDFMEKLFDEYDFEEDFDEVSEQLYNLLQK